MSDPISRDDAIKAFEEEKRKAKEIRDDFSKFPNSVFEQSIYNEAVKAWRTAINIVKNLPTVDAVPRQKYEEDMESAFAHGYTDAESNFRKMIADGELVEVVRCKDCKECEIDEVIRCKSCVWYTKIDRNTGVCVWRLEPKTKNSSCPEWMPKKRRSDGTNDE